MSNYSCKFCGKPFTNYPDLARHIIQNRTTHKGKGRRWAQSFLLNTQYLDKKVSQQQSFEGRIPLTEEQKQAKEDAHRELSGIEKTVMCTCPAPKCQRNFPERLPVEFIQSNFAWKISGKFAVTCLDCRR